MLGMKLVIFCNNFTVKYFYTKKLVKHRFTHANKVMREKIVTKPILFIENIRTLVKWPERGCDLPTVT